MLEHPVRQASAAQPRHPLFLLFRLGAERYALQAREVAEVLPLLQLKAIPHAPHWVAGVFAHRHQVVPVIDLCALTFGRPAQARTSTRLVLVHYQPDAEHAPRLLGLVVEQATETVRLAHHEFKPYGLDNRDAPYLGPVREDEVGLLQWVRVHDLLSEPVRELLFPQPPLTPQALEAWP